MQLSVQSSGLQGRLAMVTSKSHTLRAILFAALARGVSEVHHPLASPDTDSMLVAIKALGAQVDKTATGFRIHGVAGRPAAPIASINAGNSGLVLRLLGAVLANCDHPVELTGDESICTRRPVMPLLQGLTQWGVEAVSIQGNAHAPIRVTGPLRGQQWARVNGADSQPISGLLMGAALAPGEQILEVTEAGERPWIDLTLAWFRRLGITYTRDGYQRYVVPEQSVWSGFNYTVPGDWSSAAFPAVAALLTQSSVTLTRLWPDEQGDRQLFTTLSRMGAKIDYDAGRGELRVLPGSELIGCEIDMDDMIDALPILAVVGCFARGETRLRGAGMARLKESDRIAVMCAELSKMGAQCHEEPEGLVIKQSVLRWAQCDSAMDHRIALALACAGLAANGVTIQRATCINKTFANFIPAMQQLGANLEWCDARDSMRT